MVISHIYQIENLSDEWVIQTNSEHCNGVAERAGMFAGEFGMSGIGVITGLLHDRGKEKEDFQNYIKKESGYDPNGSSWSDKRHSYVGAILANINLKDPCMIVSNVIAGHHRGLYDNDELKKILDTEIPQEVDLSFPEMKLDKPSFKLDKSDISHLTRMLFSCLVDADYLDTEGFMQREQSQMRGKYAEIPVLLERLDMFIKRLKTIQDNALNRIRNKIQYLCAKGSIHNDSFYTLTVPTGGGKTIASMVWAMNHAVRYDKKRIIIAIPYTSIIIQTAQVLRSIFGDENVIEHHSVVDENKITEKNKLATENWDAPIIVTTNVQLFESIFSNRPGKCRKLHSLCNSIVILDEVQTIPLTFIQPVCDAMQSYAKMFGTHFLFCTASQPILDGKRKGLGESNFNGIPSDQIKDLIPPNLDLHNRLRRVHIRIDRTPVSLEDVVSQIIEYEKILCVVNTRKLANDLYKRLPDDAENIHLSRMMCPLHIRETIDKLKAILQDKARRKIRVVSTQLIEAGVDIDFPVVFRQIAGLDSILQAAGRCNREGKLQNGITHVFSVEGYTPVGNLKSTVYAMNSMLNIHDDYCDWFDPEIMREYYSILYSKTPSFDIKDISGIIGNPLNAAYEEASKKFKLINDPGIPIVINYGESPYLVEQIRKYGPSKKLLRNLGLYTVNVHKNIFDEFCKSGLIEEIWEGIYYIGLEEQYDDACGLKTENEYLEQSYII